MDENAAPTNNATSSTDIPGFVEGAYWEELLPQSAPVEKPTNAFQAWAKSIVSLASIFVLCKYWVL
eukprot:3866829-Ditylum_brightwellii.AAC.1